MKRALVVGLVVLGAAGVGSSGHAAVPAQSPFHVERAFSAGAEAFPVETAPGTRETVIAIRQLATSVVASNPPPDAYARAATSDLGLAEAYVGQQGPAANADTATAGGETDVVVDEGGNRLEAHVDPAPRARASATGSASGGEQTRSGTGASASEADASGERLVATAEAEVNEVAVGLLVIGSGRFDARAESNGTPGGASASGLISTSDAVFAGIPVRLGADGLTVDESRVPDPLVGPSTAALQEALGAGGYIDIRVVQPRVEVAEDGSRARVSGGGIFVFLTNNDPSERYFASYTLLGGSAEVAFGGVLALPTATAEPAGSTVPDSGQEPVPVPVATGGGGAGALPAPTGATVPDSGPAGALAYDEGAQRVALQVLQPGWLWAVIAVVLAWALAGALYLPPCRAARARLHVLTDDFADRFLRG